MSVYETAFDVDLTGHSVFPQIAPPTQVCIVYWSASEVVHNLAPAYVGTPASRSVSEVLVLRLGIECCNTGSDAATILRGSIAAS